MEVELRHQALLDGPLRTGPEEEPVGDHNGRTSILFQTIRDERHEEVRRFRALELRGEVLLDDRLFAAAVGRIH